MTDGMVYTREEGMELCKELSDTLIKAGLRDGYRESLIAEKLSTPIILKELAANPDEEVKFVDPLIGTDQRGGNYNSELTKNKKNLEIEEKKILEKKRQLDAIDKKILQMKNSRKAAPTTVSHNKDYAHNVDIIANNITIIVGGKTLLEGA